MSEFLFGLLIALTVITVVGHLIWVVLAAIFRAIVGVSDERPAGDRVYCRNCMASNPRTAERCVECGRQLVSPVAAEFADLNAFERQLKRFEAQGVVDAVTAARLRSCIQERSRELAETAGAPKPGAVAGTTPAAPATPEETPIAAELVDVSQPKTAPPAARPPAAAPAPGPWQPVVLAQQFADPASKPTAQPAKTPPTPAAPVKPPAAPVVPAVTAPPAPVEPRLSWGEILESFMEERNIRWGELIGGLLMVGSAIGLVITLRKTLEAHVWLQFTVGVAFVAAFFGVGLYAYHRWKLENTSRALLTVSTLMVPLYFFATTKLSKGQWTLSLEIMEAVSLGLFCWLAWLAARILAPEGRWFQVLGTIGSSAAVLLVASVTGYDPCAWRFFVPGLTPVAVLAVAVGGMLYRTSRPEELTESRANQLFMVLGTAGFSAAVALALLVVQDLQVRELSECLNRVSVLLALAATALLFCGMRVVQGTSHDDSLGAHRTAGTLTAILGGAAILAALGMAWPLPLAIVVVSGLGFTVLTWVAFRYGFPVVHAGALACFVVAFEVVLHLATGNLEWMQAVGSGEYLVTLAIGVTSGMALVGLAFAMAIVAQLLAWFGLRAHGVFYAGACAVVALLSLLIVNAHGFRHGGIDATLAAAVCAVDALALLALNFRWRRPWVTYLGSAVLLLGLIQGLVFDHRWLIEQPWVAALLGHATITVAGSLGIWAGTQLRPSPLATGLRRAFIEPLANASIVTSIAAIPALVLMPRPETIWVAAYLFWLAGIWLIAAWSNRSPRWLSAAQVVLTLAVVAMTTAWLEQHAWTSGTAVDLSDPRTWHVHGIGLAALTLLWSLIRIALRRSRGARRLLNPDWPAVDRLVAYAVAGGQLWVAALFAWFGCQGELRPLSLPAAMMAVWPNAFEPYAWWLVGLTALALFTALWHGWRRPELVSALLVGAAVSCLVAGSLGTSLGTASVARWSMAAWFVLGAVAIMGRGTLKSVCVRGRTRIALGSGEAVISRGLLIATSAVPVLLLTVFAALLRLSGTLPVAPAAGTFFEQVGPRISYLVPLALVTAGLVGFALRERSSGYAFSAGLVVQLGVILGYALSVVMQKRALQTADLVVEIQLAAITAAVWAFAWLIARRWVNVWREAGSGPVLMRVQLGMAALANVLLLVVGIGLLVLGVPRTVAAYQWPIASGTWLGWLALILPAGAAAVRQFQVRRPVQPFAAGLLGMAVIGLLACTVCTLWPDAPQWGYRTLMLGWAMYGLFVVLATWWVASIRTLPGDQGPPQSLVRAAAGWVSAASVLAVLLGLKAAFLHSVQEDLLWGAAAIAISSIAAAAMAVWRRQEGWALAAATGVNVAASLVVWFCQWHWRPNAPLADWWLLLVQANVIASAVVALVWLAACKRLYELRDLTVRASPLLALQTALGVLGNVAILVPAVVSLAASPRMPPNWLADLPTPAGWLALLLASAAAAWYVRQVSPGGLFHVIGGLALGVGVLAAAASPLWIEHLPWELDVAWLMYHKLTATWAAMGLLVLGIGWVGRRWSLAGNAVVGTNDSAAPREPVCPVPLVCQWVTLIGLLTVALSLLWCYEDPERPWWSIGAIAAVSLTAGLLAAWQRLPSYVHVSGLLVNVAGSVAWLSWDRGNLATLVETNALCFSATSAFWSVLGYVYPAGVPAAETSGRRLPFAHLSVQTAVVLMAALTATLVAFRLAAEAHQPTGSLAWYTLATIAASLVILLWDRSARFALPAIYLAGLTAVALWLDVREPSPREFCWLAVPAMSIYVLAAAVLGRLLSRLRGLWRVLRIAPQRRLAADGISAGQLVVAGVGAALSIWVSIDFAFDQFTYAAAAWLPGRLIGPLSALVLLAASLLMAGPFGQKLRGWWRQAAFGLGLLLLAEAGWALLSPSLAVASLHRCVILLVAAMVTAWIAGMALPGVLARESEWLAAGRRAAALLAALAATLVVTILGLEAYFYQPGGTPMAMPAVIVMGFVLAGGMAALVTFAVSPERDPMHWSDRRRQVYVYLAEVLLVLICVHLRLTVPRLFELGIIEKYWMLLVMAVAFCGVGLSEWFQRRGLPVLSEPLERTAALLPLAPAIGFWIPTKVQSTILLTGPTPVVWFLAAAFYGVRAVTRRSGLSTILSVLATGIGFCVLWHQNGIGFFERPQLWLIPVALATLIAEYLNHERLTAAQSGGLRYLASGMIYVSTTCDLFFIHGFTDHLAVPLSLLVLSVLGVLLGIALRLRSFLAMGVTFLTVSILSMIYHAAFDLQQKWVLAVCGIALGLAMLGLFAVFEKRRNDVIAAVEQLKQWER